MGRACVSHGLLQAVTHKSKWRKHANFTLTLTVSFRSKVPCTSQRGARGQHFTESQNHRMFRVGRDLCGSPSPTPCPSRVTQSRLHRTSSRRVWNISREGDATTSLGSLFQCSITLRVKKFFVNVLYVGNRGYFKSLCSLPPGNVPLPPKKLSRQNSQESLQLRTLRSMADISVTVYWRVCMESELRLACVIQK